MPAGGRGVDHTALTPGRATSEVAAVSKGAPVGSLPSPAAPLQRGLPSSPDHAMGPLTSDANEPGSTSASDTLLGHMYRFGAVVRDVEKQLKRADGPSPMTQAEPRHSATTVPATDVPPALMTRAAAFVRMAGTQHAADAAGQVTTGGAGATAEDIYDPGGPSASVLWDLPTNTYCLHETHIPGAPRALLSSGEWFRHRLAFHSRRTSGSDHQVQTTLRDLSRPTAASAQHGPGTADYPKASAKPTSRPPTGVNNAEKSAAADPPAAAASPSDDEN